MQTYASYIEKGGTGKTTNAAHMAVAATHADKEVLLVGLSGKQRDLAVQFGLRDEIDATADEDGEIWPNITTPFMDAWSKVYDRFSQMGTDPIDEMVFDTGEGPDLIPSHPGLDGLEDRLTEYEKGPDRFGRLRAFLTDHDYFERYDICVIDVRGAGTNVSDNALWASDGVFIPLIPGAFERNQLRSVAQDIDAFSERYRTAGYPEAVTELRMVIPSIVQERTREAQETYRWLNEHYPGVLAPMPIPRSQDILNASRSGTTLYGYPESKLLATGNRAKLAFDLNAAKLFDLSTPPWNGSRTEAETEAEALEANL